MFVPIPTTPPPRLGPWPVDVANTLKIFDKTDPNFQFIAGEGTYSLAEEINISLPLPHASEPMPNPNPLTTQPTPLTTGIHLSLVAIKYKDSGLQKMRVPNTPNPSQLQNSSHNNIDDNEKSSDEMSSSFANEDNQSDRGSLDEETPAQLQTPAPGESSPFSYPLSPSGDAFPDTSYAPTLEHLSSVFAASSTKRRRPKNNIIKTNSSFVSKIICHEKLAEKLAARSSEDIFVFANIGRALLWMDLSSPAKHEPLSKILFSKAHVLCHDVNQVTRGSDAIDLIMGFNTGDIIWFDPMANKYHRINKQGCVNGTAVHHISWLPGSENLFMACHMDGSIIIYDKDREDAPFVLPTESDTYFAANETPLTGLLVHKSATSRNTKQNPVSYLAVSREATTAFAFSPDLQHVAIVGDDGTLKIVDYKKERLLDVFSSYYGGFTCVTWSPDGLYIVTGGKDDLVTIWSFAERQIVARCHGHSSFVSGVAFDRWRCDEYNYRFGSIGEDSRLCLWDFALSALHKPSSKGLRTGASKTREETLQIANRPSVARSHDHKAGITISNGTLYHEVESRLCTAILSPILVKQADDCNLSHLIFQEDNITIASQGRKGGKIRVWSRP